MRRSAVACAITALLDPGIGSLAGATPRRQTDASEFWPQWRGPYATGVSPTANPPLEWSETKNIRWKVEIPGRGSASPVVWGDRVFVLTAVPVGVTGDAPHAPRGGLPPRVAHKFVVMAHRSQDRQDGLGTDRARSRTPHEAAHPENGTWASSSAITDGEHVFAYFESFGLYAYDMDGTLLWKKDLGDKQMRNQFGEGSTPALYGNTLVIVWDHLTGQSFIIALDKRTGKELWRVPREEIDTWATPLVVEVDGRAAGDRAGDATGHELRPRERPRRLGERRADDESDSVAGLRGRHGVPDERISGQRAARRSGSPTPEATSTAPAPWSGRSTRDTPYVPSPLLYDGILYFLKTNSGILSAFDAKTGKPHYQLQRLDGVPERVRRRRSAPRAASTSPDGTGRRSSSRTDRRTKCWRRTRWTTGSTRRRRSSTTRSICAASRSCTVSPRHSANSRFTIHNLEVATTIHFVNRRL